MSINLLIMMVGIGLSILAAQNNRRLSYIGLGLLAVLLLAGPFLSNNRNILSFMFILGIAAVGWNIIGGFTGYAAFGQVAFFGLGAYSAAALASQPTGTQNTLGLPLPLALLGAALIPALAALLIGLPVLRLKGHYFAIATLGVSIVMREIFKNVNCIGSIICLGGVDGLTIYPLVTRSNRENNELLLYFTTLVFFVGAVGFTWLLTRSKFGYGLFAIRENEDAAAVLGVNTTWFKVGAFSVAAALTGLAGGWQAMTVGSVYPTVDSVFNTDVSLFVIIICLFGGVGTVWGPFIGAFIYAALRELLTSLQNVEGFRWLLDWQLVILGGMVILLVLFLPKGILQLVRNKGGFSWRIFARNVRENSI